LVLFVFFQSDFSVETHGRASLPIMTQIGYQMHLTKRRILGCQVQRGATRCKKNIKTHMV